MAHRPGAPGVQAEPLQRLRLSGFAERRGAVQGAPMAPKDQAAGVLEGQTVEASGGAAEQRGAFTFGEAGGEVLDQLGDAIVRAGE